MGERPRKSDKELTERAKVLSAAANILACMLTWSRKKVWRLVPFLSKIENDFQCKTAHPWDRNDLSLISHLSCRVHRAPLLETLARWPLETVTRWPFAVLLRERGNRERGNRILAFTRKCTTELFYCGMPLLDCCQEMAFSKSAAEPSLFHIVIPIESLIEPLCITSTKWYFLQVRLQEF